ncbi:MAG: HK97-gp10 family putative phage morphogenesis protein [Candidatus Acidiferrales bacterium]
MTIKNGVQFEVKGLSELQSRLEELGNMPAKKVMRKSLREWGEKMVGFIVELAPFNTNFLRRHFNFEIKLSRGDIGGKVQVGPTTDLYPTTEKGLFGKVHKRTARMVASWIEFGTNKMAARPFMRPALSKNAQELIETLADALRRELKL